MNLRLNRTLFQQTDVDSAALTMLASVVHRPREAGDHVGTIYRAEQAVGEFTLRVAEEDSPLAVHIDLAAAHLTGESRRPRAGKQPDADCCPDEADATAVPTYLVGRGGHVVFHVSAGGGGYSVSLAHGRAVIDVERSGEGGRQIWSSRELQDGDLFAVSLLRPGTYKVAGHAGGGGSVRVAYPERGRTAYRPPEAIRVAAGRDSLEPGNIELRPLQGLVFAIKDQPGLTITLAEPEDRPEPGGPDRMRRLRYSLVRRRAPRETPPG